jgi:hypothetical protein
MYHQAKDEVTKLREFRRMRDEFYGHVLVSDLATVYPQLQVLEKLDKQETWHYAHAQAAIDASRNHFLRVAEYILPATILRRHDAKFLPNT